MSQRDRLKFLLREAYKKWMALYPGLLKDKTDFAEYFSMAQPTMNKYLNGRSDPAKDKKIDLARGLASIDRMAINAGEENPRFGERLFTEVFEEPPSPYGDPDFLDLEEAWPFLSTKEAKNLRNQALAYTGKPTEEEEESPQGEQVLQA